MTFDFCICIFVKNHPEVFEKVRMVSMCEAYEGGGPTDRDVPPFKITTSLFLCNDDNDYKDSDANSDYTNDDIR